MSKDVTQGWLKFAADCNSDGGYPHSQTASEDRSRLEEEWRRECPGLEVPSVLWSNSSGRYELVGLNVPKHEEPINMIQDEFYKATANTSYDALVAQWRSHSHEETTRLKAEAWWKALAQEERERCLPVVNDRGVVDAWYMFRNETSR